MLARVRRVLIAEPSPDVRLLLRRVVARMGYEPVVLDPQIRKNPEGFDALLLEPATVGGLELARAARARRPDLPIVICTISSRTPELAQLGAVAHVTKPFQRPALERALHAALGPPVASDGESVAAGSG
ncbi:MAG: two-component system, cell cycle response regulator CpdR [Solirubrobacteraceae bacterium]|jgi:CheY-like chemotaxis protein|nr:two-component system, cell cycle response regulator CpdR [Solirubrobacteraceae bacterium]